MDLFLCSAKLCDLALESGKIYDGEGFKYIKESFESGTLHLVGLLSDGGVHSRLDQVQVKYVIQVYFDIISCWLDFSLVKYQICN